MTGTLGVVTALLVLAPALSQALIMYIDDGSSYTARTGWSIRAYANAGDAWEGYLGDTAW